MKNGVLQLDWSDMGKALIVAILAPTLIAATVGLGAVINASGFDVFSIDWVALSHNLVNISIVAAYGGFVGYLSKNLITSNQGNVMAIGDTKSNDI